MWYFLIISFSILRIINSQEYNYQQQSQQISNTNKFSEDNNRQIVVSKHFYVHSPPNGEDDNLDDDLEYNPPQQQNIRVIFIKAPAIASKSVALKLARAKSQEKTIVYVLNKQLDSTELQDQYIKSRDLINKPEVFFVNYKTPQEAAYAQQQIQAQYDLLGGSSQTTNEGVAPVQSFVGYSPNAYQSNNHLQQKGGYPTQNYYQKTETNPYFSQNSNSASNYQPVSTKLSPIPIRSNPRQVVQQSYPVSTQTYAEDKRISEIPIQNNPRTVVQQQYSTIPLQPNPTAFIPSSSSVQYRPSYSGSLSSAVTAPIGNQPLVSQSGLSSYARAPTIPSPIINNEYLPTAQN